MINSITITNHLSESITVDLRNPEISFGFFIKSIEGLGPVKADINLREMAGIDGGFYNSARADSRNIVFNIGFFSFYTYLGGRSPEIDMTIEKIRRLTYKYFPLKRNINIKIETDERTLYTTGYVESNEPNIFSKEEDTIISVICPESYFKDIFQNNVSFGSVTPTFQFPFSNESLVSKLISFGTIIQETTKNIIYEGETPTGFVILIHAIGLATNIEITNNRTLGSIYIDTTKVTAIVGSAIQTGDDIIISTIKGDKYAIFIRGTSIYNILNAVITDIEWFELENGDNEFTYTASSGLTNIQFSIIHDVLYQGV